MVQGFSLCHFAIPPPWFFSIENRASKLSFSSSHSWLNVTSSNLGLLKLLSLNLLWKCSFTSFLTSSCSTLPLSVFRLNILFLLDLFSMALWKNFEFESPSLSQVYIDSYLNILSRCCIVCQTLYVAKIQYFFLNYQSTFNSK